MLTRGFTPRDLPDHFTRHGKALGARDEREYEEMADRFLGGPGSSTTYDCIRSRNGDLVRYDSATDEFGVLSKYGVIRTYYKPNPWNRTKYPTNLDYWRAQCLK